MKYLAIIIPCYNEEKRLDLEKYINFISNNKDCFIFFCNDGSNDKTLSVLQNIQEHYKNNVFIFNQKKNTGKANAIFNTFNYIKNTNQEFDKIAYLDADLSTSLEEIYELSQYCNSEKLVIIGSRIQKIDNTIQRNTFRHISGRVVATIISNMLHLKIYDSQCGAKIFHKNIYDLIFNKQFISQWLFDVEIFFRLIQIIGINNIKLKVKEIPLQQWIDKDQSKVKLTYFFKLFIDLFKINKAYKNEINK